MDLLTLSIGSVSLLLLFKYDVLWRIVKTIPRDIKGAVLFVRLLFWTLFFNRYNRTIPKIFRRIAAKYPDKIAFYFNDEQWTFKQVDDYTNKIACYFKRLGYKRGDSISLLMDSKPEFICMWLGLSKIGVVSALLNTNLMSKDALSHAIKSGKSNSIIFGSKFKSVVENVVPIIPELKMFQFNDQDTEILQNANDLTSALDKVPLLSLDEDIDSGNCNDILIYIYTSGTTGLPKASIIRNSRYNLAFLTFNLGVNIKAEDVMYIPAPLYHSLGGMAAASQCLLNGSSIVIKTKFSASNFWKDCEKYKCTISVYIGEMARYVTLAYQNSKDKPTYKLEKMCGNGMKPTTWKQFVETFNVGQIYEFYGSTEGNFGLFNLDNKVGSVGFIPIYGEFIIPIALIKCNASGEPIRNKEGFCELCPYNEPGLLICQVSKFLPLTKFDGYSDKESTNKKILRNVLRAGDKYFNTGDVLEKDDHGYFYFKDRTGDTFRWKGENVSTNEVEDIISTIMNRDVAVYGVEVAGSEGKAGMAAIEDPNDSIDLKQFLKECKNNLPSYSIPIFLRKVEKVAATSTFKIQKVDYQKEGYDINVVKDKIYFLDPHKKEFVELGTDLYNDIVNCKLRL